MEETKYSVEINGRLFGPFGKRRLQEFVDRGQIGPSSYLISKGGHKVPASAIPGLRFPERYGQLDAADPELVKRFSSAPRPYPVAPSISVPEEPWGSADDNEPEATAILREEAPEPTAMFVEEEPTAILRQDDPELTAILTEVEPEPTMILRDDEPTSLDMEQPPSSDVEPTSLEKDEPRLEPVVDDNTVMQPVDYDDLEAKFAAAEATRITEASHREDEENPPLGDPGQTDVDSTRTCPYCDEIIQSAAVKCRYCKEWLPEGESQEPSASNVPTQDSTSQPSGNVSSPAIPIPPSDSGVATAAPIPAQATPVLEPSVGGSPLYTCPCCRATAPRIRYVPEHKRLNCSSCGYWTDSTYDFPPPATVLATAPCPRCTNPTRYIPSSKVYYCDECHQYVGQSPPTSTRDHGPTNNKFGRGAWLGIALFAVGCIGLLVWLLVRDQAQAPKRTAKDSKHTPTPVKKAEFPFNLPQKDYLGKTENVLRRAFPNAVYVPLKEPYEWNDKGALKVAVDGYLREGRCTRGGCLGNCWRQCLRLFFKDGKCVIVGNVPGLWVNPNGGTPWGSRPLGKYLRKSLVDLKPVHQSWKPWHSPSGWQVGQMDFDTGEYRVLFNVLGPSHRFNPEGLKQFDTVGYTITALSP